MGDLITSREGWLARRRTGIGGSDAPIILLGRVYNRTDEWLRMEKLGQVVDSDEADEDRRRGIALEDDALTEFAFVTGLRPPELRAPQTDHERWNDFFILSPERPWTFANLDGWVRAEPMEIKCARSSKWYKVLERGLPDEWQIQGQHQMWVTGTSRVHFWIFNADSWKGLYIVLERDESVIAALAAAEADFWDAVLQDRPLPPRQTSVALAPVGRTALDVSETAEWRDLFALYHAADERADAAAAERDALKQVYLGLLQDLGVDHVRCGEARANIVRKAGAERLDKRRLAATHPEINLRRFTTTGDPTEYVTIETTARARGARSKGASR
jgi:putative phage-type endonuclease